MPLNPEILLGYRPAQIQDPAESMQRMISLRQMMEEAPIRAEMQQEQLLAYYRRLLDPAQAPATELAALYHKRWEIETALAELKTHLRGAKIVLRSKTPDLVRQEFYGLMMAHFAVRGLMHEAALKADADPDQLSFLHAVRVVRRKLATVHAIPPSAAETVS
jgi:hypothetical protein